MRGGGGGVGIGRADPKTLDGFRENGLIAGVGVLFCFLKIMWRVTLGLKDRYGVAGRPTIHIFVQHTGTVLHEWAPYRNEACQRSWSVSLAVRQTNAHQYQTTCWRNLMMMMTHACCHGDGEWSNIAQAPRGRVTHWTSARSLRRCKASERARGESTRCSRVEVLCETPGLQEVNEPLIIN